MDHSEYERERCKQARLERLRSNNPSCIICREKHLRVLHRHHPGGRKYTDETVILCSNHHGKAEELRIDHPPGNPGPPSELECQGRLLLGIDDLLSFIKHSPPELIDLIRQSGLQLIEGGQLSLDSDEVSQ
jgi:hypothetical protein